MRKIVLLAVAAIMVACAGTPASAQKSKDTLRMALVSSIGGISYYLDPKPETVFESEAVFDNLIIFDETNFKFEPLLASSWKQIDDKTLEFQIRSDIKWHDGQPFTVDDVIYTLDWVNDPQTKLRHKGSWDWIDHVEKTGPNTIRVTAHEAIPFALTRMAYLTAIEAKHAHGAAEDKTVYSATKPVGTSMYRVVEIDRNKHVLLEKNPDYKHGGIGKPASNVGRLQLIPLPDAGARVAQFLVGALDVVRDPGLATAEDLAKKPGVEISLGQGTGYIYLAIDAKGRSNLKALQDVRVRRAIMMGINRDDLLKVLTNGRKVRTPNAMCWEFQAGCDFTIPAYSYDPAGAKKLLAEAGYPNGFDLEITTFTAEGSRTTAQVVANQLRQIGLKTTIQPHEQNAYRKKQADGNIQAIVAGSPGGGNPDVQATMEFFYAVPASRDYAGDAEMTKLAERSLTVMDPEERKKLGRQIFDRSTDQAYFMALAPAPSSFVHTSDVAIGAGAFGSYGLAPSALRWK